MRALRSKSEAVLTLFKRRKFFHDKLLNLDIYEWYNYAIYSLLISQKYRVKKRKQHGLKNNVTTYNSQK